jgi:hypothetical protein
MSRGDIGMRRGLAHDPEKHAPDPIGDGNRFSVEIMRQRKDAPVNVK